MMDIIKVESKRILGKKYHYIILLVLIYSLSLNYVSLRQYNIYDNMGQITIP